MSGTRHTQDPKRWKVGGAPQLSGVADALQVLGEDHSDGVQLSRLEARLAAQLAAPTHAAGAAQPLGMPKWLRDGRGWTALAVVSISALISWAVVTFGAPHAATLRAAAAAVPAQAAPLSPSSPHPLPPVAAITAAAAAPAPPAALALGRALQRGAIGSPKAAPVPAAVAAAVAPGVADGVADGVALAAAPNVEQELSLLRAAQSALNRSASEALPLLDAHEQRYPAGVFVQEREMLRIEAELTLGQRTQALERAARFARRFEQSTYRRRIDSLLKAHAAQKDQEPPPPATTQ